MKQTTPPKTYRVKSFGCQMNVYDGERMGELLAAQGIVPAPEGEEADLVVLDLASTPAIAQRHARAEDIWQALFPTIMMGDDRAVAATYVAGQRV